MKGLFTRRSTLLLLGSLGLSYACKSRVREPLCDPKAMDLPPGAAGRYRVSMAQIDPQYSAIYRVVDDIEFTISDQGERIRLTVTGKNPALAAFRLELGKKIGSRAARALTADGVPQNELERLLPLNVCRIGSTYYSQTREDNGSYSYERFDLSPTGISIVPLTFDPETLLSGGFKVFYLPVAEFAGKWTATGEDEKALLLVDNRGLSVEDNERLNASPFELA